MSTSCTRFFVIFAACTNLFGQEPESAVEEEKRVEVDKAQQVLRAFEGERLIFQTNISTGRRDRSTPNGRFAAGYKLRMHHSTRYHNAPMPFSVQVNGHIFIHGFTSVPSHPASHGCIRMPLTGKNPAKWFFNWVESGTPIEVLGHWRK